MATDLIPFEVHLPDRRSEAERAVAFIEEELASKGQKTIAEESKPKRRRMDRADIRVITGDPGGGKTTTATAIIADEYEKRKGNIRILANYHLYGMKYVFGQVSDLIKLANKTLLRGTDADIWWLVDESYMDAEARRGQDSKTIFLTWLAMQSRKRNIHLIFISQHSRFVDWRLKMVMSELIYCRKKKGSPMIHLTIKDEVEMKEHTVSYNGSRYYKYFNSWEVPDISESMLAKICK